MPSKDLLNISYFMYVSFETKNEGKLELVQMFLFLLLLEVFFICCHLPRDRVKAKTEVNKEANIIEIIHKLHVFS